MDHYLDTSYRYRSVDTAKIIVIDTSLNDFEKWLLKRCFESARALDVKLSPEELSAMPLELSWVHDEIAECAAQIGGL